MNQAGLIPGLQLSIRAASSAALALSLAQLLALQHPLYALIAAVIVSDLSPSQTRKLSWRRLAGSFVGAAVGATMSQFLPSTVWVIGLSIFVSMFLSHLLRLEGAARLAGYVSGIVVLGQAAHPWVYGFHRLMETLIGVVIAVMVGYVPKLIKSPKQ